MERHIIIKLDSEDEHDKMLINCVGSKNFELLHGIPTLTQEDWVKVLHEVIFERLKERKAKEKQDKKAS